MVSASAPGRLDVMGGIADYSGSLVLQMPIVEETRCLITQRTDGNLVMSSAARASPVTIRMDRLLAGGDLYPLEAAREFFAGSPDRHWASYVAGVVILFAMEVGDELLTGTGIERGLSIDIESDVPEGKGVSSSAALEVAAMRALATATGVDIPPERMAALCQRAENHVAGAPCGIMDQMTAACGRRGHLMKLVCQPARLEGFVALADSVSVWGIDSGVRHAVTGSDYASVRAAAFMGLRIFETIAPEMVAGCDGYLANIDPVWLRAYSAALPVEMDGRSFLNRYGAIADDVVHVDPARRYPVRAATSHPILENDRNRRFAALLGRNPGTKDLAMAGELMYLSHAGYTSCGLGTSGTDAIVDMVRSVGYKNGLFGARITGGGSGGTVIVLGRSDVRELVYRIADDYEKKTGRRSHVFESVSPVE